MKKPQMQSQILVHRGRFKEARVDGEREETELIQVQSREGDVDVLLESRAARKY